MTVNSTSTANRFDNLYGEDPRNLHESTKVMTPATSLQANIAFRVSNGKKQKVERGPRAINISKEALRAQKPNTQPTNQNPLVDNQIGSNKTADTHHNNMQDPVAPSNSSSIDSMDGIMAQIPSQVLERHPMQGQEQRGAFEGSNVQEPNQPRPPDIIIQEGDKSYTTTERMEISAVGASMAREGRTLERDDSVVRHHSHSRDRQCGNSSQETTDISDSF